MKDLDSSFETPGVRDQGYLSATAMDFPQLFDMPGPKPLAMAVAVYQMERAGSCQEEIGRSGRACTRHTDSLTSSLKHTLQPDVAASAQSIATAVRTAGAQAAAQCLMAVDPEQ